MPAGHRLARCRQIERAELTREPLLLMEDGHCLRSHALRACRLGKAGDNEEFQGTSLRTLLQMTAGGLGVTLLPEMAVASEITPGLGLVARRLVGDPSRSIALAWRRGCARKQEFRSFGRYLKSVLDGANGPL
jgi:LysR family hydrogen peroxide-inducible transcriptional activator